MTDEEKSRELIRSNYAAQMAMLGYEPDGSPKDLVEVVRCKDCINNGTSRCICHRSGDPYIDLEPDDNFFCADGKRSDVGGG